MKSVGFAWVVEWVKEIAIGEEKVALWPTSCVFATAVLADCHLVLHWLLFHSAVSASKGRLGELPGYLLSSVSY